MIAIEQHNYIFIQEPSPLAQTIGFKMEIIATTYRSIMEFCYLGMKRIPNANPWLVALQLFKQKPKMWVSSTGSCFVWLHRLLHFAREFTVSKSNIIYSDITNSLAASPSTIIIDCHFPPAFSMLTRRRVCFVVQRFRSSFDPYWRWKQCCFFEKSNMFPFRSLVRS